MATYSAVVDVGTVALVVEVRSRTTEAHAAMTDRKDQILAMLADIATGAVERLGGEDALKAWGSPDGQVAPPPATSL